MGFLSDLFGGSEQSSQNSSLSWTAPWGAQAPYLSQLYSTAEDLFNNGGTTITPFSQQTELGMGMIQNNALTGPGVNDALNFNANMLNGAYLNDPSTAFSGLNSLASGPNYLNVGNNQMDLSGFNQPGNVTAQTVGQQGPVSQVNAQAAAQQGPVQNVNAQNVDTSGIPRVAGISSQNAQVGGNIRDVSASTVDPSSLGGVGSVGSSNVNAERIDPSQVGSVRDVSADALGRARDVGSGNRQLNQVQSGNFLGSNPYLDKAYDSAASSAVRNYQNAVTPGINATFGAAGRTGSGTHALATSEAANNLGEQLGNMANTMYSNAYQFERGQQDNAANQLMGNRLSADSANQAADLTQMGYGAQYGLANQQADISRAGLIADILRANQSAGLQAGMANQSAGLQAGIANQNASLQSRQQNLSALQGNQQYGLQAGMANQNADSTLAGLGTNVNLQNAANNLSAQQANQNAGINTQNMFGNFAMQNANNALSGQQSNQNAALQMAGYNNATNLANASNNLQGQLANQNAGLNLAGLNNTVNMANASNNLAAQQYNQSTGTSYNNLLGQLMMANQNTGLNAGIANQGAYGNSLNTMYNAGNSLTNSYFNGLNQMGSAASLAPTLNQASYFDANQMMGLGNTIEGKAQQYLNEPYNMLGWYQSMLGNPVMSSYNYGTGTSSGDSSSGGLGSALGSAALFGFSDIRLKENIEQIGSMGGVGVYRWDWNDKAQDMGMNGEDVGFLAQEVEKSHPEYVGEMNGYKAINYGGLIKELNA